MVAMETAFMLSVEDYAPFIPSALAGFEMTPNSARIVGKKLPNGSFKFTYTLEWNHGSEEETPASKTRPSRSRVCLSRREKQQRDSQGRIASNVRRRQKDKKTGIVEGDVDQSSEKTASHPKVDIANEPDWLYKYPDLWPTCQIVRNGKTVEEETPMDMEDDWSEVHSNSEDERRYREKKKSLKERKAARRHWVAERKRDLEKQTRREKKSHGEFNHVRLCIVHPDGSQQEMVQPANPELPLQPLLLSMCRQAGLDQEQSAGKLYKRADGQKRQLRHFEELLLRDVDKVDNVWNFLLDFSED